MKQKIIGACYDERRLRYYLYVYGKNKEISGVDYFLSSAVCLLLEEPYNNFRVNFVCFLITFSDFFLLASFCKKLIKLCCMMFLPLFLFLFLSNVTLPTLFSSFLPNSSMFFFTEFHQYALREKCPNTEFFLVRIFPHSD